MSDVAGCVLVETDGTEQAGLPGVVVADAADLETALAGCIGGVDVVVVGSRSTSPVALVQRAYRAVPDAGVVVVARGDEVEQVRRSLGYAPGVPLDVRVVDDPAALPAEVAQVREAVARRRHHRQLLAAVSSQAQSAPAHRPELAVELGALLEHAPLGVLVCDADGRVVGWNRRAGDLLIPASSSAGTLDEVLPGASALVRAAGAPVDADVAPVVATAAGGVEVEVSAVGSRLPDGQPVALLLVVDVTERRSAERARDRLAGQVALLSRVSEFLTSTLDKTEALERLADALVPDLADWVSIQLADEVGGFGVVTMRHHEEALADVVEQARRRQSVAASDDAPSRRAARGGRPILLQDVDDAALERLVPDAPLRDLFAQLGVGSVVAVPLPGRRDVLGSLVLVNRPDSRLLSEADVDVALEVGRRAGVALDNARLYAQQRDLATELQRSLLTEPPQPDHGEIVVRYVAAAEEAQVGGDWYDAFLQPDGATVLVIGDVVGHDTRAASGMSQLRGVLRGIGYTTSADPAEVLSRVDAAIEGLLIETTATAVICRLEQDQADVERARTWLTWSNAGHPPPIVVHADGGVTVLDGEEGEADLLLGIDPQTPRTVTRVALDRGATVLLYTDGLVERRGQSLDEGLAALVELLRQRCDLPLDELCDAALHDLLPDRPEDDVALVAVRLHRQDRPRPPEAGPNRVPGDLSQRG